MKKIVVIGNSIAGLKAIEDIRSFDQSAEITLMTMENSLPYSRELLPGYVAQDVDSKQVLLKPAEYFREHNIKVITQRKINRINFKRNKIFTEDKEAIEYDYLLITDTQDNVFPEIKGTNKRGVYSSRKIDDVNSIVNDINFIDTIVVQTDSLQGLNMAKALRKRGKEVVVISSAEPFMSPVFDNESEGIIKKALEENDVRIVPNNSIAEILGEGEIKAVKLQSGKVYGCQAVIFADAAPGFKMFKDAPLIISKRICADDGLKTNLDNVYVLDDVMESEQSTRAGFDAAKNALLEQGRVAASNINGEHLSYTPPLNIFEYNIFGVSITLLGATKAEEGIEHLKEFDAENNSYKDLFILENSLIGAVLINAQSVKSKYVQFIKDNIDVSTIRGDFKRKNTDESQADVLSAVGNATAEKVSQGPEEGETILSEQKSEQNMLKNE